MKALAQGTINPTKPPKKRNITDEILPKTSKPVKKTSILERLKKMADGSIRNIVGKGKKQKKSKNKGKNR